MITFLLRSLIYIDSYSWVLTISFSCFLCVSPVNSDSIMIFMSDLTIAMSDILFHGGLRSRKCPGKLNISPFYSETLKIAMLLVQEREGLEKLENTKFLKNFQFLKIGGNTFCCCCGCWKSALCAIIFTFFSWGKT